MEHQNFALDEFLDTDAGSHVRSRLIFPAEAAEVFFTERAEDLGPNFWTEMSLVYYTLRECN